MLPRLAKSVDLSKAQPGDLVFVTDTTPVSLLIKNAEGDFNWSHVCSIWLIDGVWKILTTGAFWSWRKLAYCYGMVDAVEYLSTREWCLGRRMDLSPKMQQLRFARLMQFVDDQTPYATAKVLELAIKGRTTAGVVNQLHRVPEVDPSKVFCAESEAIGIIDAKAPYIGRSVALMTVNSKYPNKLEACVHTPETLYDAPETAIVSRGNENQYN